MANRELEGFYIPNFQGGWQPDKSQGQLQPNEIPDLLNVEFTEGFGVRKRDGFEKITTDVAGMEVAGHCFFIPVYTTSGLFPNFSQQTLYFNGSSGDLYKQSLGELIEQFDLGTGTNLVDTGHSIGPWTGSSVNAFRTWELSAVTFGSVVYVTGLRFGGTSSNGTVNETEDGLATGSSKPIKYDVQTDTITRPTVHALAGATSGFPKARCAITKYSRVFVANVYSQGNTFRFPSRLYWSEEGTAETFESTSYIEVGADDGSEITCIASFGESILIFKEHSVWTLVGTDEDTFALYSLDASIGTPSQYSAVSHAGFCYFLDATTGIWSYDGARFVNISEPINARLLSLLNLEASFKTAAWVHDQRIYFSIPIGDVSTGPADRPTYTFVWDTVLESWVQWDFGCVAAPAEYSTDYNVTGVGVSGDGKFFASAPDGILGIAKMRSSLNDNGVAISARVETAWMNPGELGDRHRLRRLEVITDSPNGTIAGDIYRDFNDATAWGTISFTPTGALDQWHQQDQEQDVGLFSWLKLKLSNATLSETFKINGLGLSTSTRRQLRRQHGELNQI